MKKNLYYQYPNDDFLYPEYWVRKRSKTRARKYKLTKDEREYHSHWSLNDMRSKDFENAKTRRDMMRLGLVW